MKAFFIFKPLNRKEIASLQKNMGESIYFYWEDKIGDGLRGIFTNCFDLRIYRDEINNRKNYHLLALEVLREWSDLLIENQRFGEFLSAGGVSLFEINFKVISNGFLRWALMGCDLFSHIFMRHSIKQAVIIGRDSALEAYIRTAAIPMNIKVENFSPLAAVFLEKKAIEKSLRRLLLIRSLKLLIKTLLARISLTRKGCRSYDIRRKKILAFLISGRHTKNLLPLLKSIHNREEYGLLLINDLYGERLACLDSENMPYNDLIAYSDWNKCSEIMKLCYGIINKLRRLPFDSIDNINFCYGVFSLNALLDDFFYRSFHQTLFATVEKLIIFKDLLSEESPSLILNCNDTKYVSLLARRAGIQCIGLAATSVMDIIDDGRPVADLLFVGSNTQKEILREACDFADIEVVGEPRFDDMNPAALKKKAGDYRKFNRINNGVKIVFFASTYSYDNDKFYFSWQDLLNIFRLVYKSAKGLEDIVLVTKMHPYEKDSSIHKAMAVKYGLRKFILEKDVDSFAIMAAADVVIDTGSTMGLDAIILGKPLITVIPGQYVWSDIYLFQKYGLSGLALNEEELSLALKQNLYNDEIKESFFQKRQRYLNENKLNDQACRRINAIIDSRLNDGEEKYCQ